MGAKKGQDNSANFKGKMKAPWKKGESGNPDGLPVGTKHKATLEKEALMEANKLQPGENTLEWMKRLMVQGIITPEKHSALILKVMDKEVGNAPQVQLNADLNDSMDEAEVDAIFKKAGVERKGDQPTKH